MRWMRPAVRRWSTVAADALDAHRAEIDELNVFPVPDGDTGTNLSLTLRAAAEAVGGRSGRHGGRERVLARWREGAVLGARGNSGVIIAQVLRGLADGVDGSEACDGVDARGRIALGRRSGLRIGGRPIEGTILSVARAAADAARCGLDDQPSSSEFKTAAWAALRRTTDQLPVLAQAGVVDAGGRGLVVLIDALGQPSPGLPSSRPRLHPPRVPDRAWKRPANPAAPTTTTRCSICCALTRSTPRFFGRNFPRSVTRWSW